MGEYKGGPRKGWKVTCGWEQKEKEKKRSKKINK